MGFRTTRTCSSSGGSRKNRWFESYHSMVKPSVLLILLFSEPPQDVRSPHLKVNTDTNGVTMEHFTQWLWGVSESEY